SPNQRRYLEAIEQHDMVFGVGPAGTGKTYLAVAMAISALLNKQVNRIILARPAVEAGERLGFLPGTLQEKIDPYLRPLYDALFDMLDAERVERYLEKNIIEIAPIAFMRGRTLNDSFVILDEAQNTTSEQMKMFVTRLGFGSKAVITGDITQIDLPNARRSGLLEAIDILQGVNGLAFVHFDESDVVRHHLVQRIIRAYDEHKRMVEQQLPLLEPRPALAGTTAQAKSVNTAPNIATNNATSIATSNAKRDEGDKGTVVPAAPARIATEESRVRN
ncbi:MAG: PhoH family protein, partial [Terriglobales bacterium]